MPIVLTEKAAAEVKRIIQEQGDKLPEGALLRVGVAGGGCSGFQYDFRFDDQYDALQDTRYDQHGIALVVDKKSEMFLEGTTIDFYDGIEKRGFTFKNPNATKSCGCGSSFQV